MRDPAHHLKSLADSLENLESFLHAKQVFWTRGNLSSLSLGGMYWDRLMLSAEPDRLDPELRRQFDRLQQQIDRVADRWRVAWEQKALAESRVRLNLWRAYLADLGERRGEAQNYPNEIRNRLFADYLLDKAGSQAEAASLKAELQSLDGRLSGQFERGEFVWEPELAGVFPEDPYWYLYGRPKSRR